MAENEYHDCPWCGGSGVEVLITCKGVANVKCIPCDGHGRMTPLQMEEWSERSTFGRKIALLRLERGLTQRKFADQIGINLIRLSEIGHVEYYRALLSPETRERLEAFEIREMQKERDKGLCKKCGRPITHNSGRVCYTCKWERRQELRAAKIPSMPST